MRKLLQAVSLAAIVGSVLVGCSSGGDISQNDIQKNAKAQADWIAAHPSPPGDHVEH
jgi:hypothetical protein